MKLALVIPVINHQEETLACMESFRSTADNWQKIKKVIVDNGSENHALEWGWPANDHLDVLRHEENIGVLPALQDAYRHLQQDDIDYIIYTHNDVTMYEQGWDTKIIRELEGLNAGLEKGVGVAGFFGAKGIGTSDLYVRPYQMQQLIRIENVSGCYRMPAGHGYRRPHDSWERVAVMDGFSLIVSMKFLNEIEGFDLNLPPHHNYDNHTCLQSIDRGYWNVVIAMDAVHHGGVTDVSEDWSKPFGKTKSEIHQDAHYPYFYEYWMPGKHNISLPYYVQ